jgi:histidinol-phosphatase (PHP family)
MNANYHTHTYRCGHAEGKDNEYAEEGIRAGLKILGFSDHTPYDYFDAEPRNRPIRMTPEELPGYAASVRELAENYADRIEILLGVEAEYYPKYFPRLLEMLRENGVQYMILGQHFLGNEIGEAYSGRPTLDSRLLERYVSQTAEALETVLFSCFAHPDLFCFTGDPKEYEAHVRALCRRVKELDVPLEFNLLGLSEGKHYPDPVFWRIAGEEQPKVILGCDAHSPEFTWNPLLIADALRQLSGWGLTPLDTLSLRPIR